jgi:hypothetical protein
MPGGLTADERQKWDEAGYLHLRSVLSAAEISRLREDVEEFEEHARSRPGASAEVCGEAGNRDDLCLLQAVSFLPALDTLVDHPGVFGKILDLMGPYLQVAGSEILVRYPRGDHAHRLHTDGGPALARIFPEHASAVITLKVQFFLTDVLSPDAGNMVVVPGSHRLPFPETREAFEEVSRTGVQVRASAGDAVLFPWSLWHGATANRSGQPRISAVLRYAQLWARPVDYQVLGAGTLDRMTPRRRRLFGDLGPAPHPGDYYRPPTGEHLAVVLGPEWAGDELSWRYQRWETFSTALYSTGPGLGQLPEDGSGP